MDGIHGEPPPAIGGTIVHGCPNSDADPPNLPPGPDLQDSYPGQGRGHSAGVSFHKGTTVRRCDQFQKWNV